MRRSDPAPKISAIVLVAAVVLAVAVVWRWQETDTGTTLAGSGHTITEERPVSGFTAVSVSAPAVLHLRQDSAYSLSILTDDNIMPLITSEVHGGTLEIGVDHQGGRYRGIKTTRLQIDLALPALARLELAGAVDVRAGEFTAGDLRMSVSGATKIAFSGLTATALHLSSDGASSIALSGMVDTLDVSGSGQLDVAGETLMSRAATVRLDGAGHVAVRVSDRLEVTITGSGVVEYAGDPIVTQQTTGIGVIRRLGS